MLTCRDEFERVEDWEKVENKNIAYNLRFSPQVIKVTVSSRITESDVAEEVIRVTAK